MGKTYDQIDATLANWIKEQHLFFVATAPRAEDGLINCSPKGLDSFAILDPHTVAYLDMTGSGIETMAHIKENGRITILFCALNGAPKILRLYGMGEVLEPGHADFDALRARFPEYPGVRSVIRVSVQRIADSCGFGVPRYEYVGERDTLIQYAERLGPEGMREYQVQNNSTSLDGLPGIAPPSNPVA